ncbi:MAG: hypothetical protein ACI8W8_000464 [Rhodothermales bacterium]|jgi:hypothetical protein
MRRLFLILALALPAFATPESALADAQAQLDALAADHITLAQAEALRSSQLALKAEIEALDDRATWISAFSSVVTAADEAIASRPLRVDSRDINHASLLLAITAHYNLMSSTGAVDFTRFAGIAPEDVAGLDSLADYFSAQRIGNGPSLPTFALLSPLGSLQFLDRLVRKYGSADESALLRQIDGTAASYSAALAAAASAATSIPTSPNPLTVSVIRDILAAFETRQRAIQSAVIPILEAFAGEAVFATRLRSAVSSEINRSLYRDAWNAFISAIRSHSLLSDGRVITAAEINAFPLPYNLVTWQRYPGAVPLNDLIPASQYSALYSIDLSNPLPDSFAPSDSFAYPARRFQLLIALLRAYPDVDFDTLRARLLISPALEVALDQAETLIADRVGELRSLADYDSMVDLLLATAADLRLHFQPLLADVVWDTSNEVTSRVDARFAEFANAFDAMLPSLQAHALTVDDRLISFDPGPILDELLLPLLDASAIGEPRDAWLRLTGISPSTLSGLRSSQQLNTLKTFSFNSWSLGPATSFDRNELLFRLVPRLVHQFGSADPGVLLAQLSAGLTLPVPLGQNLEASIKSRVSAAASRAIKDFPREPTAARARLAEFANELAPIRGFAAQLSPGESAGLESWINWERNTTTAYAVRITYDQAIASVGSPISNILRISQFPTSSNFNRELFVGISDDDLIGVEASSTADAHRYFHFHPSTYVSSNFSALGRVQLATALWNRHGLSDVEAFRRRITGVDAMIARVVAAATEIANSANAQLQTPPSSVAEATALHQAVLETRAQLLALLQAETSLHEKNDVIEAETPVTAIFQNQAFERWVALVASANLGHPIIAALSDISAAHELAGHYGLSLDDIRGLHRLENYLGEQVIALPRTSEYVEIVSQLSELGWLQLAELLVQRHGSDLNTILAALSDRDTALASLHLAIDNRVAEFANQLDAAGPDLEALDGIMNAAREALVRLANDFLAGLTDADIETIRAELKTRINTHADTLTARRDSIVTDAGLGTHIDRFIEIATAWLATNPAPEPGPIIFFRSSPDISIWLPPIGYDPSHHPTRHGIIKLFHRLVDHLGDFAQTAGVFDMDKFEAELLLTESDRARRRLIALRDRELPIAQALIQDPLPLAEFANISTHFLQIRAAIQAEANHDRWHAQSIWQEFVDIYEDIQDGQIALADGSHFSPALLDEILLRLDSEDAIDPAIIGPLQSLIDAGENWWAYEQFRQLDYIWFWEGGGLGQSSPSDGSLTLGALDRLPAVEARMLDDLEVHEGIQLIVTVADPATMLGLLNVRAIGPGSGVSGGGLISSDASFAGEKLISIADGLSNKSWRFRVTELLPALIDALGGITDPVLFEQALRGDPTDFDLTTTTDDSLGEIEILQGDDGWQLHARPFQGFRFRGWSGDINWLQDHRAAQQQLQLLADAFLVANFAANRPPIARPDGSGGEGPLRLALLDNDEDEDGDLLSAWLTDLPAHGQASLSPDGQLDYTPSPGFSGRDVLRYAISDGDAESAPTLVTIDVIGVLDLQFQPGWNLFSVPFEVEDASDLPELRMRWNGKRFVRARGICPGVGYWAYSPEARTVTVRGGELGASDVPLKPGWNLLGPVTRCVCPAASCITSVLAWDANSATLRPLANGEQLEPGQAYWVHVSARCVLRLAD